MTDERLCAWEECGLPENHPHHRDRAFFEWHPFEAAPSTDEGEARWERTDGAIGDNVSVWNLDGRYWGVVPHSLEDAIRAPLEERIRELEAIASHTDGVMHIATERITELEAESSRLREALRPHVDEVMDVRREAAFRYPTGPLGQSPVHIAHVYDRRESFEVGWLTGLAKLRALASHPSSTEGTE